ncbi:hypothetical protein H4219_005407 [Mycoemilia scoparia]|uniref:Uncharacterized protein n=1 Tax=Mycoemilia scoparia TaxID=417184 RepID=A0A9W7ZN29_9FUNG|nr:hypothetical protein H4219_005407 [Mycoemilia scoparia]
MSSSTQTSNIETIILTTLTQNFDTIVWVTTDHPALGFDKDFALACYGCSDITSAYSAIQSQYPQAIMTLPNDKKREFHKFAIDESKSMLTKALEIIETRLRHYNNKYATNFINDPIRAAEKSAYDQMLKVTPNTLFGKYQRFLERCQAKIAEFESGKDNIFDDDGGADEDIAKNFANFFGAVNTYSRITAVFVTMCELALDMRIGHNNVIQGSELLLSQIMANGHVQGDQESMDID